MSLAAYRAAARGIHKVPIGATGTLTEAEETESLTAALLEYSRDRPLEQHLVVTSTAAQEYDLGTLITGFSPDTHQILSLTILVGTDQERQLDPRDWMISRRSAGAFALRFLYSAPTADYPFVLHYTQGHTIADPSTNTVPAADRSALHQLAASYVLQNAANKFSINAASSIQADAVTQSDQAKSYSFQSDDARKNYAEHILGVTYRRSARVNYDLPAQNGWGRLHNNRRWNR